MNDTINNYYNAPVNQYLYDSEKLNFIIQKLTTMDQTLETLKQQLIDANAKLDDVNTSVDGISGDVTFLKNKIDNLANNGQASPAELAELATLGNSLQEKVNNLKGKAATLDASTDSSQQVQEPPVQ